MTGSRVFTAQVGTIFEEKAVLATVVTSQDGQERITYHCNAVGIEVKGDDIVWSAKALAFKKGFGAKDGPEDKLDEAMALAFMHWLDNGI